MTAKCAAAFWVFSVIPLIGSCGPIDANETREYRIETEGAAETKDRHAYASLGDVTFTMTQKYRITLVDGEKSQPHYLVFDLKQRIGEKVELDEKGFLLPIVNGSKTYECTHYYDVKIEREDETSPPVCEFKLVGYMDMDGTAKIADSEK